MPRTPVDALEASVDIAAPPARVWQLVSDPRNYTRWSPQTAKTFVVGGEVKVGARLVNVNRMGARVWPTNARITALDPERRFAFQVKENGAIWSYDVAALPDGGTRLTERREAPEGISGFAAVFTKGFLGGIAPFTDRLRAGMQETLTQIKAEAEA